MPVPLAFAVNKEGSTAAIVTLVEATTLPFRKTEIVAAPTAVPGGIWKLSCPGETKNSPATRPILAESLTITLVLSSVIGNGTVLATAIPPVRFSPKSATMLSCANGLPLKLAAETTAGAVRSNAPMSAPSPPVAFVSSGSSTGRRTPRWSVATPELEPLSIAGLPNSNACVWVGPPLFCSGPSCGLALMMSVA